MASDNHKITYQDNIQRVVTPSVIIQPDTRCRGKQQQHTGRIQGKPGKGLGSQAGNPPGLWLRVPVPHKDIQPITPPL